MVNAHQRRGHDRYQSGATHYNEIEVLTDKVLRVVPLNVIRF